MSSILDALNKLEEEQAQAEIDSTALEVAPEVAEKDLVSPSVIRDRMTFRLSPILLALGGLAFVIALVTVSVAVSLAFLRSAEPGTQLAEALPFSGTVQTSPGLEPIQPPPERNEPAESTPSSQVDSVAAKETAAVLVTPPIEQAVQEVPETVAPPPQNAPTTIDEPQSQAVSPTTEITRLQARETETAASTPEVAQSARSVETRSVPEPIQQRPIENQDPEIAARLQTRSSTPATRESPPPSRSLGWNETPVNPAADSIRRSAAPRYTRPSASAFDANPPNASRRTVIEPPQKPAPPETFDVNNLPPILSAGVRERYGIGRIKVNMLRAKSETNPYATATINRLKIYEGDPIQGTGTILVRILPKGLIIEIASSGDLYFLPPR